VNVDMSMSRIRMEATNSGVERRDMDDPTIMTSMENYRLMDGNDQTANDDVE
jgi:hypothetical protein